MAALKDLLAFNSDSMIKLYFKGFFVDMAVSSNQRSCKIKIVVSITMRPVIIALLGDNKTSKVSDGCYEPCFCSWLFSVSSN